jgi:DNA-binding NarL/FixJ family response regulator
MTGLRVILAEDDVLLREGLASLLERSGFEIVGQAGDREQLLTLVQEQMPALVVVDIRMPQHIPPRA